MPNSVFSSPVSDRTGSSVPIAVVANAEPTYTSETTTPTHCGERTAEPVGDRERHRPPEQREFQGPSANALDVDLVAGEEEQHAQPEIGEELR